MKKTLILTILSLSLLVTACGSKTPENPDQGDAARTEADSKDSETGGTEKDDNKDASEKEALSLSDIYSEIESSVELIAPVQMPDSYLENTYGIDLATLEEYVIAISEEATSAETIAILKAKDEEALKGAKAALEVIVEEKSMEMENYLPDQYELVSKSTVKTRGQYAYLVISENADSIISIIEENI